MTMECGDPTDDYQGSRHVAQTESEATSRGERTADTSSGLQKINGVVFCRILRRKEMS